jgi:pilus assembly protein Flp/PilA
MDMVQFWQSYIATKISARFTRTEQGAALVEYALLVALIAVVCIAAITFVGNATSDKFSQVGSKLA